MYWSHGTLYWPLWYWPVAYLYWPWIGNVLTAKLTVLEESLLDVLAAEADLLTMAITETALLFITATDDP